MSAHHRPKTRLQTAHETLQLLHLPENCLSLIVQLASQGAPWKERCQLAEVCRSFRHLFATQAFTGRTMHLDLNTLSYRLLERKRKAAARAELLAAVSRYAPSATQLSLRYQLDRATGMALGALLAPLAPRVRQLDVEDGLCPALLACLGAGGWRALEEVSLVGCQPWIDLEPHELTALESQLAGLPEIVKSKIVKFECSCQGMQDGGESIFCHLTALRSLELEDWVSWDAPRDYVPLRAMRHLTRLVLNIVDDLGANLENLLALTQVQELSLLGCYHACRGLPQLTNLVMLDLQELGFDGPPEGDAVRESAAAWKVGSLTELRWCGDLAFDEGEEPVRLPRLVALEIDEACFPPSGFHRHLCTALTALTSLRLVGGRCPRLPPEISHLAQLQVLAIDSCQLPAIPPSISALTAVTNLMLSNTVLSPHVPAWVLQLPIQKLWLANNQLSTLLPPRSGRMGSAAFSALKTAWLSRLTHVCLSSNNLREVPAPLLEHATSLVELDLSYNTPLQISSEAVELLGQLACLRLLRLEKSYWLRMEDRWTRASLRAVAKLQRERLDVQVDYQNNPVGRMSLAW